MRRFGLWGVATGLGVAAGLAWINVWITLGLSLVCLCGSRVSAVFRLGLAAGCVDKLVYPFLALFSGLSFIFIWRVLLWYVFAWAFG